jgi:glc operon protein GlcG
MYRTLAVGIMLGCCLAVSGRAQAQSQQQVLTLEAATRIADAAQAEATRNRWNVVIAVVDAGGYLVHLRRLDGTQLGSVAVAEEKAKSAVLFRRGGSVIGAIGVSGVTAEQDGQIAQAGAKAFTKP